MSMHFTVDAHDVRVGERRTLRVGLLIDPDGVPRDLILAMGVGTGARWREDPSEGLALPAGTLDGLVRAFLELQAARDGHGLPVLPLQASCESCGHDVAMHDASWPCQVVGCGCSSYEPGAER